MSESKLVHVAVGLIVNANNEVLISLRHPDSHQGGLWEFPGGKVEAGEQVFDSLQREFMEELGVSVQSAFPVRKIVHDYSDKQVMLDVWRIDRFAGEPAGLEGQQVQWCAVAQLHELQFPAANLPISQLLNLPDKLAITPPLAEVSDLQALVSNYANHAVGMIQLRQKQLSKADYRDWYAAAYAECSNNNIMLISNPELDDQDFYMDRPIHLTAENLRRFTSQQRSGYPLVSASCHDLEELQLAEELGLDFVLLSPVQPTAKYRADELLGWERFAELASQVSLPVYALGGLGPQDLAEARRNGAWGIGGISQFLEL